MGAHLESQLRRLVGRIDDPQVVADLVLHRLAERIRYYKGWGTYVWDGHKWRLLIGGHPNDWSSKHWDTLVRDYVVPTLKRIVVDLKRFSYLQQSIFLSERLSDKTWIANLSRIVVSKGWLAPDDCEDIKIVRPHKDILNTEGFLPLTNGIMSLYDLKMYPYPLNNDLFFPYILKQKFDPSVFSPFAIDPVFFTGLQALVSNIDIRASLSNIYPSPEPQAPVFFRLLEALCGGNAMLGDYLQVALGSALTGSGLPRKIFVLYGRNLEPINIILKVVANILGEYALQVTYHAFQTSEERFIVDVMKNMNFKRMIYSLNFPHNEIIHSEVVGLFCLYNNFDLGSGSDLHVTVTMANTFITMATFPKVGGDLDVDVFFKYVYIIPFTRKPSNTSVFRYNLERALMKEARGILHWLIIGAFKYIYSPMFLASDIGIFGEAKRLKDMWIEKTKKPLPTRMGQTQNKNRL